DSHQVRTVDRGGGGRPQRVQHPLRALCGGSRSLARRSWFHTRAEARCSCSSSSSTTCCCDNTNQSSQERDDPPSTRRPGEFMTRAAYGLPPLRLELDPTSAKPAMIRGAFDPIWVRWVQCPI